MNRLHLVLFLLACLNGWAAFAEVRLPGYYTDHMVLQRDQPVRLYGWAVAGEKITVQLAGNSVSVKADRFGKWKAELPVMPAGGPYQLSFTGKNRIVLNDILVGDVWLCSGQSNMEWKMAWLAKEKADMGQFDNPAIRVLTVPQLMSGYPADDVKGASWKTCTPENALEFSAVATYFARFLQQDRKVPVGVIVSSWGGTDIEPWMSAKTLSALEKHLVPLGRLKDIGGSGEHALRRKHLQQTWEDSLVHADEGIRNKWYLPETNDEDWKTLAVPGVWDNLGYKGEGVGWFRKTVELSEQDCKTPLLLSLGQVHNKAELYFNGQVLDVSMTVGKQKLYIIQPSQLRKGRNLVAVKVFKFWSYGGFIGKAADMYLQTPAGSISLAGEWKFRPGFLSRNPLLFLGPNTYPASLFNAMIHPFVSSGLKGVAWYQGENNVGRPDDYAWHLKALVNDWRNYWHRPDLPFLIVQLPNFTTPPERKGNFVRIRAAQQEAVTLPNVGLAVTVDIGDSTDIHPVNKRDVGHRLYLLARRLAYGEKDLLAEGPLFLSARTRENTIELSFSNAGSGLVTPDKYGYVKGFELAGADGRYYWAQAFIRDNKVMVSSDSVKAPVHLRYAWTDNPDAGLFNSEGLPAAPFQTSVR